MGGFPYIQEPISVQLRWMIRRDMPEVLKIENASFEFNWTEEDFLDCLRQRNCTGSVAEYENRVVGFMVYELHKRRVHILNFAVAPRFRRLHIGDQMIDKIITKLFQQRRQEIVLEVRETNVVAQLFFHNQGFRATGVLRNHYSDSAEDAYVMQYMLPGEDETIPMWHSTNRIADYWHDLRTG